MAKVEKSAMHDFVTGEVVTEAKLDQNFEVLRVAVNDTQDLTDAKIADAALGLAPDRSVEGVKLREGTVTPVELDREYIEKVASDTHVLAYQSLMFPVHTRKTTFGYDGLGRLETITEKSGETVVKQTTLAYNPDGTVATVTEVADGDTVIRTLVYTSGRLTDEVRSVTLT